MPGLLEPLLWDWLVPSLFQHLEEQPGQGFSSELQWGTLRPTERLHERGRAGLVWP